MSAPPSSFQGMRFALLVTLAACGSTVSAPKPAPVAAAIPTSTTTPCFGGAPLPATKMWRDLEKYSWSLYAGEESAPPKGTYGSCTVERNIVRDRSGAVVAELGCGVRVLQRGILDDLGLQIGATGQEVLDRKRRPVPPLTCTANGPDQVRCSFGRDPDTDHDASWYVVAGTLDKEVITADEARSYFARRQIVEVDVSIWCH
jgi:hypothetical protein